VIRVHTNLSTARISQTLGEASQKRRKPRRPKMPILSWACRKGKHCQCFSLNCMCRECGHRRIIFDTSRTCKGPLIPPEKHQLEG